MALYNQGNKVGIGTVDLSDINAHILELNILGWNVPTDCPLQNEVVGNKFIQKINRVDLGTLDWQYRSSDGLMLCQTPLESKAIAETDAPNIYCSVYKALPRTGTENVANTDKSIALPNRYTIVHDSGYTDGTAYKTAIKGTYLYYELATPIEKVIEENEILAEVNEKFKNTYRLTRPEKEISADGSLDDCNSIGEWQVVKAADAQTIENSPFNTSGYRITVESRYGTDDAPTLRQMVVNNYGEKAERDLNKNGAPISEWRYSPSYLSETELKMLGYTVPRSIKIKNTISNGIFTQRVGRVDLGSLDWTYNRIFTQDTYKCKPSDESKKANIYCAKYNTESNNDIFNRSVIGISINDEGNIRVNDPTYTDANTFKTAMKGQYLYYELATPITKQIDGNEVIEKDAVTAKVNNFVKPTSNAEILALSNGIYSINVDDTSLFPCRWGTLIVLKSGYVYGSMIFIGTDASYWFRNISSGAWRETWWQKLTVDDWKMMAETQASNTMEFPLANLPSGIFFQGVLINNTGEYGQDYVSFCKDQTKGISVITPFKDTDRAISYDSSTKTIKVTGTGYYRRFYVKAM